jgi:MFS transporter, DHA2 family, multidrug resistance protein
MHKLPGIKHLLLVIRHYNSTFDTKSPAYKWWLLANVMIGTFMAVLDATIVNVGLPKIMASFGVGVDKIEWVLTGYMLSMAVMLPTSGWLADRFGYKRVYFLGLMLFTFGSFLCGISSTENMLIASRVVQGLGAGSLMPVGMAIITREFPVEKRGVALGFWSIASAASVSFGPLIGGYLVDNFNWQLIFDVNIPVGIAGMFATAIIQKEYRNKKIRSFDLVGFLSVTIFLPLLLYALTEGNASTNSGGWHSPQIYICLTISALAFIVFMVNELVIKEPLIELRLLKDHNFGLTTIITFIFGVGMFGSTFLIPLYLQTSLGYTAIQAGMVFLPLGLIQGFAAPVSGFIADRINAKLTILAGGLLLAFSFYLNSHMSVFTEHTYIMLALYLRGLAMGMMFSPLAALGLITVPREKMAQASGLNNVIRQVGGSFGVAMFSTLLTSRVVYHTQVFGQAMDTNSPAFHAVMQKMERFAGTAGGLVGPQAASAGKSILFTHIGKQAFVEGVNDNFLIACLVTLLCMVPVFFLKNKKKAIAKSNHISPSSHE